MEMSPALQCLWHELLTGRELLIAYDLRRESCLIDPLLPVGDELSRRHNQRVVSTPDRVLLDERETNLCLTRSDAISVDDAAVLCDDASRALISITLERCQRHRADD